MHAVPPSRTGRRRRQVAAGLCAATIAFCVAGPAGAETDLTFGVYASDKPSAMVEQIRPTIDVVERKLGALLNDSVHIKLEVLPDYRSGREVLTSGQIDFARLGGASYVTAKKESPDIELLVAELNGDAKSFGGVICPTLDSPRPAVAHLKVNTVPFRPA